MPSLAQGRFAPLLTLIVAAMLAGCTTGANVPGDEVSRASAALAPTAPASIAASNPVGLPKLRIQRIGVAAPLHPVGLTAEGAMDAPTEGDLVGWYSLGPLPGGPGNAVLAGHVDWEKRPAVFWRLRELGLNDEIALEFADGRGWRYQVQWVEQYLVGAEPLGRVYEDLTVSALTLITCIGEFDHATGSYRERLVVRAVRR